MRSVPEFILIALIVTLTPGPATAMIIRMAARDGRRAAVSAVVGNGVGVLMWGALSALGVSSLVLASRIAYDALRIGGALVLIVLGVRSLLRRRHGADPAADEPVREPVGRRGWRLGLITSVANPKLAVFFVALFPQFLAPNAAVLPGALAMSAVIVCFDVVWFSTLAWLVDRARALLRDPVQRGIERVTGAVLVGLGVRLATEAR